MPIEQVLNSYGVQLHGKRCKCPVHHGEHLSASVHDNKLHCFKCGQSWDAIALICQLDNTAPLDAAKQLNDQYALGLTIGRAATSEERMKQQKAAEQHRKQREAAKALKNWNQNAWITLSDYYRTLKRCKEAYAPAGAGNIDQLDPRYIEALQKLDYISYCLDTLGIVLDRGDISQHELFFKTHRTEVSEIGQRMRRTGRID